MRFYIHIIVGKQDNTSLWRITARDCTRSGVRKQRGSMRLPQKPAVCSRTAEISAYWYKEDNPRLGARSGRAGISWTRTVSGESRFRMPAFVWQWGTVIAEEIRTVRICSGREAWILTETIWERWFEAMKNMRITRIRRSGNCCRN